jgi:hypothetical protein
MRISTLIACSIMIFALLKDPGDVQTIQKIRDRIRHRMHHNSERRVLPAAQEFFPRVEFLLPFFTFSVAHESGDGCGDLDSTHALNSHSNTPNFISQIHFNLPYMVYILP